MKLSQSGIGDLIDHDEEYFLMLIEEHDLECPLLSDIWEQFYDGPRIYPNHAHSITSELDLIDNFISSSDLPTINAKSWSQTYKRLRNFFTAAYKSDEVIQCISD